MTVDVDHKDNVWFRARLRSELENAGVLLSTQLKPSESEYLARKIAGALGTAVPVFDFVTVGTKPLGAQPAYELRFRFYKDGLLLWPAGHLGMEVSLLHGGSVRGEPVRMRALQSRQGGASDAVLVQVTRAYDDRDLDDMIAYIRLEPVLVQVQDRMIQTDQSYESLSIRPHSGRSNLLFEWGQWMIAACPPKLARGTDGIRGYAVAEADERPNCRTLALSPPEVPGTAGNVISIIHYFRAGEGLP